MFGLFRDRRQEQQAYDELYAFLTEDWRVRERYARAFLDAFRRDIAKLHKRATRAYETMRQSGDPGLSLYLYAQGGKRDALAHVLAGQAVNAYMVDLRSGRYVGTDVEKAIWAVLANRSDIVSTIDRLLARYIDEHKDGKFPRLYDDVFESDET